MCEAGALVVEVLAITFSAVADADARRSNCADQPASTSSSSSRSQLGPWRRSPLTSTDRLSSWIPDGGDTVVTAQLTGPFDVRTTGLTFPGRISWSDD